FLDEPGELLSVLVLTANQFWYVVLAAGFWPLFFLITRSLSGWKDEQPQTAQARRTFFVYAFAAGGASLAFSLMHLGIKIRFDITRADIIYGRYNDATMLLFYLCGLAAIAAGGEFSKRAKIIGTLASLVLL